MKFESATEINASPEQIWSAVGDPEEWSKWMASIEKIEKLDTEPLGAGSRIRVVARARVARVNLLMTITEFVPPQRVVMEGKVLGTRLTRYYTLEPKNEQTRVTAGGEASGPMAWLVSQGGQALSNEIVQSFKKKIEGELIS
jgi:carbon monoxide dehydrogenase subunit G